MAASTLALNDLRAHLGWGGFLHDFRNGVLRRSPEPESEPESESVNYPASNHEIEIQGNVHAEADAVMSAAIQRKLLDDTLKFSNKVASPLTRFGVRDEHGNEAYCVQDNGPEFDIHHAETWFQDFQRLHSSGEYDGSGIGPATVKHAIERRGGKVSAEAKPDTGARFFLTLG